VHLFIIFELISCKEESLIETYASIYRLTATIGAHPLLL